MVFAEAASCAQSEPEEATAEKTTQRNRQAVFIVYYRYSNYRVHSPRGACRPGAGILRHAKKIDGFGRA
jgi:hypothetical protein